MWLCRLGRTGWNKMIIQANEAHKQEFQKWFKHGRLEERTCRPVRDGKKVPTEDRFLELTFLWTEDQGDEPLPAGRVMLFDFNPRNRSAEFGYILAPEFRGRGLAKTMIAEMLDHAFENLNLNKLYCQTAAFNAPSVQLLRSLGFNRDGVLREHHELDGQLWDDYVFSMLREEWKALASFRAF